MPGLRTPLLDSPPLVRHGLPEYVKGESPAAAAHFEQGIVGDYHTRLIAVHARLVTSAVAGNRTVLVEYRDGEDNRFAVSGTATLQAASLTVDWLFNAYLPEPVAAVDASNLVPLAPIMLKPTFDFRVFVSNVQAGDQLSRIRFLWERFYSDPYWVSAFADEA